ncbi:hypothetical protein SAMN04488503_2259 [Humidesulfovibrio mexicanus]|uniref:Uncharacterized protein n=1 Tax=Humidesulfovibrio mexicanus TaxID=147047 RepID=A0A239AW22_9BACT|nr:hypothetical protein [Humidesulfovibrio mexicanus]SNR99807.1 hypothetical protein SAMN04488503_2259 [Humidesulfovibrio mexicanus]
MSQTLFVSVEDIEKLLEDIPDTSPLPPYIAVPTQAGLAFDAEMARLRAQVSQLQAYGNEQVELRRQATERLRALESSYARRGAHLVRQAQHLHETRQKLRKVEGERDGHRDRAEARGRALRGILDSGNLFEHHELARVALAATEDK